MCEIKFFGNYSFRKAPILRYWHCTRDSWQLAVQRYLENRLTLRWRHLPPRLPTPAPGRASWLPEPLRQTSTPWGEQEEVRSSSVSNPAALEQRDSYAPATTMLTVQRENVCLKLIKQRVKPFRASRWTTSSSFESRTLISYLSTVLKRCQLCPQKQDLQALPLMCIKHTVLQAAHRLIL